MQCMNKSLAYIFGALVVCITACNSTNQKNSNNKMNNESSIKIDSLRYEYGFSLEDSAFLSGYSRLSTNFSYNDTDYVVIDNLKHGKIIIYSLTQPVESIIYKVPKEMNPSEHKLIVFKSPREFYYLSETGLLFHFINNTYSEPISINDLKVMVDNGMWVSKIMNPDLNEFAIVNDSVLLIPVDPNFSEIGYDLAAMNGETYPVTAFFNLNSKTIEIDSFLYLQELLDHDYGLYSHTLQSIKNSDTCIYYAGCLPYFYLSTNNNVKKIQCKSKFQTDSIMPLVVSKNENYDEKIMLHAQLSGNYSHFIYNKHFDCYYRIFTLPLPEKNQLGYFNTFKDTRISVIIMNNKFQIIDEVLLPSDVYFISVAVPTKLGLIINRSRGIGNINNGLEFYQLTQKPN